MLKIKKYRKTKIFISIIGVLVVFRLCLPVILKNSINYYLGEKVENYYGSIDDFDLALWRGNYSMQGLALYERNKDESLPPIIAIDDLDISIAWRAVFKGRLLIDLVGKRVSLSLSDSKDEKKTRIKPHKEDAKSILTTLIPFKMEKIKLIDSKATFANFDLKIPAKFTLKEINGEIININNMTTNDKYLPSTLNFNATLQESGKMEIRSTFDILKKSKAFDGNIKIENLNLPEINSLLLAYGPVSFTSGKLSLFSEIATKEGKIKGYLKPFIYNLDVVAPGESFKSFKHFGIEIIAASGNLLLRTGKAEKVATQIDFEGDSNSPEYSISEAIWITIKNAFTDSLKPKIDKSIEIEDVKIKSKK